MQTLIINCADLSINIYFIYFIIYQNIFSCFCFMLAPLLSKKLMYAAVVYNKSVPGYTLDLEV